MSWHSSTVLPPLTADENPPEPCFESVSAAVSISMVLATVSGQPLDRFVKVVQGNYIISYKISGDFDFGTRLLLIFRL